MTTQAPLIETPDPILESYSNTIYLDQLPPDEDLISPPVTKEFVRSLIDWGQLQEIAVGAQHDGTVKVITGRRRIKGCRAAGFTTVRARVFIGRWEEHEREIVLVENGQRSPNLYATLQMIQSYDADGIGPEGIYERTGLDRDVIDQCFGMLHMKPELVKALLEHKMPKTAALQAYKLDPQAQDRLIHTLQKNGRVQVDDVSQVKEARRQRALRAMPVQHGMEEMGLPKESWIPKAVMAAQRLRAIVPDGVDAQTDSFLNDLDDFIRAYAR